MLRLLNDHDVKAEFKDKVTQRIHCPVLNRMQTALMCFACSRKHSCNVPRELGIAELDLEDVIYGGDQSGKATFSTPLEESSDLPSRTGEQVGVDNRPEQPEEQLEVNDPSPQTKKQAKDDKPKKGRGSKKSAIIEYLETHPQATVSEVRIACNVSYAYARHVLEQFRRGQDQLQESENPPPTSSNDS